MVCIEHLETPAFLVDVLADGSFAYRDGNRPLYERTGLGQRLVEGRSPQDVLPAPVAAVVTAHYRDCVSAAAVIAFEEHFEIDGAVSHWRTTLVPIHDPAVGRIATLLGTMLEITDSKRAELDLHRANAQLSLALQAVQGTHWQYDINSNSFEAAPTLALLLGEDAPRAVSLDEWVQMIPAEDRPRASFHPLVDGTLQEQSTQFRIETAAGEQRWLKCRRLAVKGAGTEAMMIFGVTVDVTEQALREQRLTREAHNDGLTPLLNRRGFLGRLEAVVAESERDGALLSILMLDLDRFKAINDTYGHAAGDAVLAGVGQDIEAALGPGDFAARLGGDEFAVALRRLDDTALGSVLARLRRRLSWPCKFREHVIPVSVSIGATRWFSGQRPLAVMEAADHALYADKRLHQVAVPREPTVLRRTA